MTGPAHPEDDRLLELAYGELGAAQVGELRRHVDGCPRCRSVLEGIAEVRSAVRRVPPEPAPERGLESLLAYGEQAAARARAHRRNVRWLGLLTLATATGLAFVLLPERRTPGGTSDTVARMEAPHRVEGGPALKFPAAPPAPVQGDRLGVSEATAPEAKMAEKPKAKDAERKLAQKRDDAPDRLTLDLKQARPADLPRREAAPAVAVEDEARRAGTVAAAPVASPPAEAFQKAEPRQQAKKLEAVGEEQTGGEASARAKAVAAPAKVAAATPAPPASSAPSAPSAGRSAAVQAMEKMRAPARAEADSSQVAGLLGGSAGGASADKGLGTLESASSGAKESKGRASTSSANAVGKVGGDRAVREARLAEVRRSVATATGDARKALLLEQCRLEASLELRASAVGTCSQVAREFPGTEEARQAVELARGFSVQPPSPAP